MALKAQTLSRRRGGGDNVRAARGRVYINFLGASNLSPNCYVHSVCFSVVL